MHYKATKQQVASRDKKKFKTLMTWSDDEESTFDDDSNDEMINLSSVGLDDDDIIQGII